MSRPVSILDLTPIDAGASARQALQVAVDLAVLADRLGYGTGERLGDGAELTGTDQGRGRAG